MTLLLAAEDVEGCSAELRSAEDDADAEEPPTHHVSDVATLVRR